jgi:deoxyribodipyrimidine photo-lyase
LVVRIGKPEVVVFELAKSLKTQWVYCNRERTYEEVLVQDALEHQLWTIGQEIRYTRGKMLYYTSDLPFPITHTPENFTAFRKEWNVLYKLEILSLHQNLFPIKKMWNQEKSLT